MRNKTIFTGQIINSEGLVKTVCHLLSFSRISIENGKTQGFHVSLYITIVKVEMIIDSNILG